LPAPLVPATTKRRGLADGDDAFFRTSVKHAVAHEWNRELAFVHLTLELRLQTLRRLARRDAKFRRVPKSAYHAIYVFLDEEGYFPAALCRPPRGQAGQASGRSGRAWAYREAGREARSNARTRARSDLASSPWRAAARDSKSLRGRSSCEDRAERAHARVSGGHLSVSTRSSLAQKGHAHRLRLHRRSKFLKAALSFTFTPVVDEG